jgi:hypothetical protein
LHRNVRILRCACITSAWEIGLLADEIGDMEKQSMAPKEVMPE